MLTGIILCAMAALLPSLLLYLPNTGEISLGGMLPYFGIMLAAGLLAWAVMRLITRRNALAALSAALGLLVFLNIGRLVPVIHAWNPLIGIRVIGPVLLILFAGAVFGLSRLKEEFLSDAVKVVTLGLAATLLASAAFGLIRGSEAPPEENAASAGRIDISPADGADRPNIWWIVADEYAGSRELEKYYHYDNGAFCRWLRDRGFTVSEGSYNWNSDTYVILRDTMNLGYTGNRGRAKEDVVADPDQRLWNLLRDLGYDLCEAESTNKFRLRNRLTEKVTESIPCTAEGDAVANLLIQYSILYRWEESIIERFLPALSKKNERETLLSVFAWGADPAHAKADAPTFTLLYVKCPHAPFYFDREGNAVPAEHDADYGNRQYYLDQLVYTTGRLQDICGNILAADPDAVIILQSDHGMRFAPNVTQLDQTNILNAVYYRGEPLEGITDANGLNTWIAVLNRQFSLGIPPVEERRLPDEYREDSRDPSREDPNAGIL